MIYLASPFFTPRQSETVRVVENMLTRLNLAFFSPRQHGVNVSNLSEEERKGGTALTKVFEGNVRALDNSTLLIACIDKSRTEDNHEEKNADAGTMFEIGYFYRDAMAFNKAEDTFDAPKKSLRCPIALTFSGYGAKTNLMISQAVAGHFNDLGAMEKFFKHVRKVIEPDVDHLPRDLWKQLIVDYYDNLSSADIEEK